MSLDVPTAVMQGDSIWLNCTLDLESDDLYSVKWYKDDVEFYRHLPQDSPSGQKYDIPGIRLDRKENEIPVDPWIDSSVFLSFFGNSSEEWVKP
ncbi:uncharacterized protein TNIN_466271 [Trichonephila inaurata madagascariensis]|uniref:Ig-like domain-containing protein n=1 Tax=Trichonephila inaurata madagascariensis TaxID=2747483 RepID=A0A8X7C4U8_9ARAC|nr:uncharacterized protein TNIN_466271 [Trichonephila inaurata madagascariensis]